MDAVLYYEIKDAAKASYAVENIDYAVVYLAQSAMRNAIGKYKLDELFVSRKMLNDEVLAILKEAIKDW
jgi:regulator of protease activity HflC (stomatin/prohibitin superfamily)